MDKKINIVVLDARPLDWCDIDWTQLKVLGNVVIYDQTSPDILDVRIKDAGYVITNKVVFDRAVLERNRHLKYIGITATGYNTVDIDYARELGITVTNVPSYGTDSVAEMIFAFMLEFTKQTALHSNSVHNGEWASSKTFSYFKTPLTELKGKTLGIIGFGHIGRRVAELAEAFHMPVKIYTPRPQAAEHEKQSFVTLNELWAESDFIALCCPLNSETAGIINKTTLAKMKRSAFLINTGRGGLVIEDDLAHALNSGIIAGAGLDVLSVEPPPADNPLLDSRNTFITPHIAWGTAEARQRMFSLVVSNLKAFIDGHPVNSVTL
jgi:glycerate dehydrogenase